MLMPRPPTQPSLPSYPSHPSCPSGLPDYTTESSLTVAQLLVTDQESWMGTLQMGHSILVCIHWKRQRQWKRCPQEASWRQLRSSVKQIVQVWSGADVLPRNSRSNFFISFEQLRYFPIDATNTFSALKAALSTEKIHMQSRMPMRPKRVRKKSRMRLQKCQSLTELPVIFSASSNLQVGCISLMFWLQQQRMSFSEAALLRNRNSESISNISTGNTSRFSIFMLAPENATSAPTNAHTLTTATPPAANLDHYNSPIVRRSNAKPFSNVSFSVFRLSSPRRTIPAPTQAQVQMTRSNMFQSISESTRMTMARWQKGEYSREAAWLSATLGATCSRRQRSRSTASLSRMRPISAIMASSKLTRGSASIERTCLHTTTTTSNTQAASPTSNSQPIIICILRPRTNNTPHPLPKLPIFATPTPKQK